MAPTRTMSNACLRYTGPPAADDVPE